MAQPEATAADEEAVATIRSMPEDVLEAIRQKDSGGLCECLLRLFALISTTRPSTLVRAELFTLTGDEDNKDPDTGIYITVKTSDDRTLLASINNADSSGKDMTTYNDDSHHIVPLVVEAPGATRAACGQFKVRMSIKTKGEDRWTIDEARVTLYFADATTLVAQQLDFDLINDGASTEFQSP